GADADLAQAGGHQRREQVLDLGGGDVVRPVNAGGDAIPPLILGDEFLGRADVNEPPFATGGQALGLEDRVERFVDADVGQRQRNVAGDERRRKDVELACLAQQRQHLPDVFVFD